MKSKVVIILVLIGLGAAGGIYAYRESSLLKREGVYVLGVVTRKNPDKYGSHYLGTYTFKGKQYGTDFSGKLLGLQVGSLFFVELASEHPKVNHPLFEEPVPRCLTVASVPADGWKVLPSYCNNPCGQPVRFSQLREFQFVKDNLIPVKLLHIYSFHGGCQLRGDTLYANVFKGVEIGSGDTLLIFSPCTHSYDFANVDYPPDEIVSVKMGDRILQHPDLVFTALEDGDVSTNDQYIIANIDHNLGHN